MRRTKTKVIFSLVMTAIVIAIVCIWAAFNQEPVSTNRTIAAVAQQTQEETGIAETSEVAITTVTPLDITENFEEMMDQKGVTQAISENNLTAVTEAKYTELATNRDDYANAKGVKVTFGAITNYNCAYAIQLVWPSERYSGKYEYYFYTYSTSLSNKTVNIPAVEFNMYVYRWGNYSGNDTVNISITNVEPCYDEISYSASTSIRDSGYIPNKVYSGDNYPSVIINSGISSYYYNYYYTLYEPEVAGDGNVQVAVLANSYEAPEGKFEDGSTVKFYSVPTGSTITGDDFESPINTNRNEFRGYNHKTNNTSSGGRTFSSVTVTNDYVLTAYYDQAVKMDYYELAYDFDTDEVTKTKIQSLTEYSGWISIPEMEERDGYMFYGWAPKYKVDEGGLNLSLYALYYDRKYVGTDMPNEVYCAYYLKGGGPFENVYISNRGDTYGYDENLGKNPYDSVYSLERAMQLLKENGTIWVADRVYLNTGSQSYKDAVLTLEGFGENAKFKRAETCKNEMFVVESYANRNEAYMYEYLLKDEMYFEFRNVVIDGSSEFIRSDSSMIVARENVILNEGTVLENNRMSWVGDTEYYYGNWEDIQEANLTGLNNNYLDNYNYNVSYLDTDVEGGAALRLMHGADVIMNEGSVIRNNSVIYKTGEEEFEHEWLEETEIINVTAPSLLDTWEYYGYEDKDVTLKLAIDDIKDVAFIFDADSYVDDEVIIYDKNYNPCYYIYPETYFDKQMTTYGDVIYIRFKNGLSVDSRLMMYEISNYSKFYPDGYIEERKGALGGGAIALDNEGAEMTMNGGEIYGNYAYWGGAIYVGPQNHLTINGGKIYENEAEYGGAIYTEQHMPTIAEVYFGDPNPPASVDDTAMLVERDDDGERKLIPTLKNYEKPDLIINDVEIYNNIAHEDGGAIYVDAALYENNGGNIYNNTAENSGGGIYISDSISVIEEFELYLPYYIYQGGYEEDVSLEAVEEVNELLAGYDVIDSNENLTSGYYSTINSYLPESITIPGNEVPSTFEMNGGNIYGNTAYVGGGIYNANKCLLKAGNIYENNTTKSLEETKNYAGDAVYAFEDVVIWPNMKLEGDVRVCVDEGANIITPEGLATYESYSGEDKNIIEVSVEEDIAHEDYVVVKGTFSKTGYGLLTKEQIDCVEAAKKAKAGKHKDIYIEETDVKNGNYQLELNNYLLTKDYIDDLSFAENEMLIFENEYRNNITLFTDVNGVYESTATGSSYLISEAFTLDEAGSISFEYAQSGSTNSYIRGRIYDENGLLVRETSYVHTTSSVTSTEDLVYSTQTVENLEPGTYHLEILAYRYNVSNVLTKAYVKNMSYQIGNTKYELLQSQYEINEKSMAGFKEIEEGVIGYEHNGYYAEADITSFYGILYKELGTFSFEYANTSDTAKLQVATTMTLDSEDTGGYQLGSTVENGEVTWKTFEYTQKDVVDFLYLSYESEKEGDAIYIRNLKFTPFRYTYANKTEKLEGSSNKIEAADMSLQNTVTYFEENNGVYSSAQSANTRLYIDVENPNSIKTLEFDWAISAATGNSIIVELIDKNTAEVRELDSFTYSGTAATTESELSYSYANIEIPAGEFYIAIRYNRSNSTSTGLNKAYLRDITIDGEAANVLSKEKVQSMYGFELIDGVYTSKANAISKSSILYDEEIIIEEDSSIVFDYLISGTNSNSGSITINISDLNLENIVVLKQNEDWQTVSIPLNEGTYAFGIIFNLPEEVKDNYLQIRNLKIMKRSYEYNAEALNYALNETDLSHVEYVGLNNWKTKLDTETNQIELTKEIEITKVWEDNENQANLRPEIITLEVLKNGESQGNIELTAANDWKYTIKETGRADWDEEEPIYALSETEVENYTLEATNVETGKVTLTNKLDKFDIKTSTDGEGGTISGKDEDPYEEVDFGETTVKVIEIIPDPGYQVDTIKINDIEIEFTETDDHIVVLEQIENVTEDKNVVVTFKKIEAQVTVHHYIAVENEDGTYTYTENRVLKADGTEVADEIISGYVGETYTATQSSEIADEYVYISRSDNNEDKVFVEGGKVVNFYYKLANINIKPSIDKEGTAEINSIDEIVEYTINYQAEVNNYVGTAELIVVDTLPYEIDETLSDIAGGTYDAATKTITWTETINSINTVLSGTYTHNFSKSIKVVYKDVDVKVVEIKNIVVGTMKLLTTGTEDDISDEFITDGNYVVDIPVEIIWNDTENPESRPDVVIVEIYEGDTVVDRKEVNTNENTVTFEDLDKYDDNGDEIEYTIKEKEKNQDDLYLYTIEEDNENYTITNTYEKLNEKIDVTVNKVWDDNNNSQNKRPSSIVVVLYADGVEVNRKEINEWTYTFENLPKYNSNVNPATEIVYTVKEEEKTEGDLAYYIGSVEGYTLTNKYKNLAPQAEAEVEKVSTDVLTTKDGRISYEITYSGVIKDYYGTATVTLVDNLPYRIDTNKSSVNGATYNETQRTLTWTEEFTNIDTYTNGEYKFEVKKEIELSYINIDVTQKSITNSAYGTISYNESDVKDEETEIATCENEVDLKFDLEVEKEIIGVYLNDNERTVSDPKLAKISMRKSQVSSSELYVEYMITVRNTGALIGEATVIEEMPEGLSFVAEQSDDKWYEDDDGLLKADLSEINPGDTVELVVVGKWNKKAYGTLTNEVRLENVENEAGFDEVSKDNNTDSCEMIVDTFTGISRDNLVLLIEFIVIATLVVLLVKPIKEE